MRFELGKKENTVKGNYNVEEIQKNIQNYVKKVKEINGERWLNV